ncbi:TPA: MFS transporter [Candidatus Woesearchaeota archaeon]|nr:MFS transporter [Candidatus Woesearchaeota archaeon]HII64815.1 MFS transporter [Candidatus Woesearchaeota archaeon]
MKKGSESKLVIVLSLMSGMFLAALDQTIVPPALPAIVAQLGGLDYLSWVVASYLFASTATIILYGKLSDMYGRKRFYILGIAIFLAGSFLSGISGNIFELIVFRALQGIGGGAIMSNSLAIIGDLFPPKERGKWQGFFGATFALSSVAGPLLGGFITDALSWHWIFFINLPIGIVSIIILTKNLPHIPGTGHAKIDYKGSATLISAIVILMFALESGSHDTLLTPTATALFASSAALFVLFAFIERKAETPILPPFMFRNRTFLIIISLVLITGMGMFGAITYLPLFLQAVLGASATNSGLVLTPMGMSIVASSMVSGRLMSRTGRYRSLTIGGMAMALGGMFTLSFISAQSTYIHIIGGLVMVGIGMGITFPIFTLAVQGAFDKSMLGVATSSMQFFRSIGGLFGVTAFGTVLLTVLSFSLAGTNLSITPEDLLEDPGHASILPEEAATVKEALANSLHIIFLISTVLAGVAVALSVMLKDVSLEKPHAQSMKEAAILLGEEEGFMVAEDGEKGKK